MDSTNNSYDIARARHIPPRAASREQQTTEVGDAVFVQLQSTERCGLLPSPSYSCDGDEAFCQITLDRFKLHLRKSSCDAFFCRITAAMVMRLFVQLHWIGIDLE